MYLVGHQLQIENIITFKRSTVECELNKYFINDKAVKNYLTYPTIIIFKTTFSQIHSYITKRVGSFISSSLLLPLLYFQ